MSQLATAARAKKHPALADVETSFLENLLKAASGIVETYCNRAFDSTAYATENHDGDGGRELFVFNPPITAFTSILVEDAYGDTETVLAADFDYDPLTGLITFSPDAESDYTWFPRGVQNIKIAYTGGYAAVPDEVQEATILIAMALYEPGSQSNPGFKSERMGEYSYTRSEGTAADPLSKAARAMLAGYRIYGER